MKYIKTYALAIVLAILQILDGILTYIGVLHFGVLAEGNPLISFFMKHIGVGQTLFILKFFSLYLIYILCFKSLDFNNVIWLNRALFFLVMLYSTIAIVPWVFVLAYL